jgi:hypothetical protein
VKAKLKIENVTGGGRELLERPGNSGHELNPGSFARDWIRANSKVRSRL